MDQALIQVGLPVRCVYADCGVSGYVKPSFVDPEHGGWYKSRLFRRQRKRWYCPKHHQEGRAKDKWFYDKYQTPEPEKSPQNVVEELYKLI
jgi:hypothetical protein